MSKKSDKTAGDKAIKPEDAKVEDTQPDVMSDMTETKLDVSEPDQTDAEDAESALEEDSESDATISDEGDVVEDAILVSEEDTEKPAEAVSDQAEMPQLSETAPVVVKRTGFLPVFLGGVAAAAVGFVAALSFFPDGLNWSDQPDVFEAETVAQLNAQSDEIAALKAAQSKALGPQDLTNAMSGITAQLGLRRQRMVRLEAAQNCCT